MKKLLLGTILVMVTMSGRAQEYDPFPDEIARWIVRFGIVLEAKLYNEVDYSYQLANDSLIDGTEYSLFYMRKSRRVSVNADPNSGTPVHYSLDYHPFILIGAIREDEDKKVWFKNLNFDNWWDSELINVRPEIASEEEVLLFDFGLEIGDTIEFFDISGNSFVREVTQIWNGFLGRKTIRLHKPSSSDSHDVYWVEGIGAVMSNPFSRFAPWYGYGENQSMNLRCFSENGTLEYQYSDGETGLGPSPGQPNEFCVGGFVSLDEFYLSDLSLWPNPTMDLVHFSLPQGIDVGNEQFGRVEVHDIFGRVLWVEQLENSDEESWSIDLSPFPVGIYVIKLLYKDYSFISKVIKE